MEEDNKAFHQAKAEAWEQLAIIEQLMRIYKLGHWKNANNDQILHKLPTCLDLRDVINDLQNRATKELRNSNVFGQTDSSDFPVMTKSYDGEQLFEMKG